MDFAASILEDLDLGFGEPESEEDIEKRKKASIKLLLDEIEMMPYDPNRIWGKDDNSAYSPFSILNAMSRDSSNLALLYDINRMYDLPKNVHHRILSCGAQKRTHNISGKWLMGMYKEDDDVVEFKEFLMNQYGISNSSIDMYIDTLIDIDKDEFNKLYAEFEVFKQCMSTKIQKAKKVK